MIGNIFFIRVNCQSLAGAIYGCHPILNIHGIVGDLCVKENPHPGNRDQAYSGRWTLKYVYHVLILTVTIDTNQVFNLLFSRIAIIYELIFKLQLPQVTKFTLNICTACRRSPNVIHLQTQNDRNRLRVKINILKIHVHQWKISMYNEYAVIAMDGLILTHLKFYLLS